MNNHYMRLVCADDAHELEVETETETYRKSVCKRCGCIIEEQWKTKRDKITVEGATNSFMDGIGGRFKKLLGTDKEDGK